MTLFETWINDFYRMINKYSLAVDGNRTVLLIPNILCGSDHFVKEGTKMLMPSKL
jgi:hypothetical protein